MLDHEYHPPTNDVDMAFIMYRYYNFSMNYSDSDLGSNETAWEFGPTNDRILLPGLLCAIAICSLVSNGLVIYNILAYRRMRTGFHLMLVNIAVSDLAFILCTVPVAVVNHAKHDAISEASWLVVCKSVHYVIFVTVYVTVYTLVVTSVFCFLSERSSTKTNGTRFSRVNAVVSCIVIWVAFLASHVNLLIQKDPTIFQEPVVCAHAALTGDQIKLRILWVTFLACGFLLPLTAVCVLSGLALRRQSTWRSRQTADYKAQSAADLNVKRELTLLLMATIFVRSLCWLPIQLFVMVDVFEVAAMPATYRTIEVLAVGVAMLGSCVGPLIYATVSSAFRQALRETSIKFGCKTCCGADKQEDQASDMNETIMSIISDSSNHINYG